MLLGPKFEDQIPVHFSTGANKFCSSGNSFFNPQQPIKQVQDPHVTFNFAAVLDIKFMAIDLNQVPEDGEGEPLPDLNNAPDQADDEGQEEEHTAGRVLRFFFICDITITIPFTGIVAWLNHTASHLPGVQNADQDGQPPVNQSEHHFDLNISAFQEDVPAHDEHEGINPGKSSMQPLCTHQECTLT